MVHPSLVEGWLIDQERERAEEELDRNRKRVRPDSVPLPNKSNRRGRRSRLNESFADASKHKDRTAPQGLVLRRSTRRTRATKNISLSNAAQLANTQRDKRPSAFVEAISEAPDPPSTIPSANTRSSGDSSGKSSKRRKIGEQREDMLPNNKDPSRVAICFTGPGDDLIEKEAPEDVRELVDRFSETVLIAGCIPEGLKSILREKHRPRDFPDYLFSSTLGGGEEMLEMVKQFSARSLDLKAAGEDEAVWNELAGNILAYFGGGENRAFVETNVTGKHLNRTLYPDLQISRIDRVLALNKRCPKFSKDFLNLPRHIPLSAFADANTKNKLVVLGVEVKSPGGRPLAEAETQLAVWAVRTGRVYLDWVKYSEQENEDQSGKQKSASTKIKPIIGVSVVGSSWSYHVAYLASDPKFTNTFVLLGEYPIGNTNTVIGIFKIAKFISLVREWSMEELWPWCVELLGNKGQVEPVRPARPIRQVRLNKSGKQGKSARRGQPSQ